MERVKIDKTKRKGRKKNDEPEVRWCSTSRRTTR
jgi:hypothetical protein